MIENQSLLSPGESIPILSLLPDLRSAGFKIPRGRYRLLGLRVGSLPMGPNGDQAYDVKLEITGTE